MGPELVEAGMSGNADTNDPDADAAAWLARLHAEEQVPETERAFRSWLEESPDNRSAFDRLTMLWDAAGGVGIAAQDQPVSAPDRMISRRALLAGSAALCAIGATAFVLSGRHAVEKEAATYSTAIGAQDRVLLPDGSLALLDTNSRIEISFDSATRQVSLTRGRAHFDVAKDRQRPFIVTAEKSRVTALGTKFDVAQLGGTFFVALIEGQVAVQKRGPNSEIITLTPGERLTSSRTNADRRERFDLAKETAWQSGKIIMDNMTLGDAVAEMNRYSKHGITIEDLAIARLKISGVYGSTDIIGFAQGVALLHSLNVQLRQNDILLSNGST
jgi:transmembrane sensor